MVKRKYLQDGFDSFIKAAYSRPLPIVQKNDLRCAFMGGAAVLMKAIMGGLSPGNDVEDSDIEMMDAIEAELVAFGHAIRPRA